MDMGLRSLTGIDLAPVGQNIQSAIAPQAVAPTGDPFGLVPGFLLQALELAGQGDARGGVHAIDEENAI